MAGAKDMKKRAAVRKLLKLKKWQAESDRSVSTEAKVSRTLVTAVRLEMIALGEHPRIEEGRPGFRSDAYQPGASARGGYVFDEQGRTVREVVWMKRQAARKKLEQTNNG
jgi:hypothetical protein